MDSEHIATVAATGAGLAYGIVVVMLFLAAVVLFKNWLNSKIELRKVDTDVAFRADLIELQKEMLKSGTQNMRILEDAIKRRPLLDVRNPKSHDQ